jgi:hypothetical protein
LHRQLAAALLAIALVTTATGVPEPVRGADAEDPGAFGQASQPVADTVGPIDTVVAPTNAAPAFHVDGERLRVELDPAHLDLLADEQPDRVRLDPAFGHASHAELGLYSTPTYLEAAQG